MNITFGKLLKADLRKRLWLIVLIFAVSIIAYPLFYQMFISSISDGNTTFMGDVIDTSNVSSMVLGWRNRSIYYVITFAAFLSAVTGFAYLHSDNPEMTYQGRRVDGVMWFRKRWVSGYLAGIIPTVVGALIALFATVPINIAFSPVAVGITFSTLGMIALGYSAIYAVCVLAMVLTGKIISGILMCALFLGYAPMCSAIVRALREGFFPRIYYPYEHIADSPFMYFSPATSLRILAENPANGWAWISIFAFLIGGIALGFLLNKHRTEETPGYAMLYDSMRGIVKVMWGIPVALVAGEIFTVFSENKVSWLFIVGAFIGAFVVNIAIQYVFNYDLESNKRHLISGGVIFGGVTLAILILFLDPFSINKSIPKAEDVSKMSVASSDTAGQMRLLGGFMENENNVNARDTDWLLTNTFIENFENIYVVAGEGVKNDKPVSRSYTEVYVGFELKDGKRLYRRYNIDLNESQDAIDRLSELSSYRERFYPTAYITNNDYKSVQIRGWDFASFMEEKNSLSADLNDDQCKRLTEAIKNDSLALSSNKLKNSMPIGKLLLKYEGSGYDEVYIYSEFEETVKVLRELKIKRAVNKGFFKLPDNIESAVLRVSEASNALQTASDSGNDSNVDVEDLNNIDGMLYGTYRMEAREYDFAKNEINELMACLAPARAGVQESKDRTFTLTLKRGENEQDFYEAVVTDEATLSRLLEGK